MRNVSGLFRTFCNCRIPDTTAPAKALNMPDNTPIVLSPLHNAFPADIMMIGMVSVASKGYVHTHINQTRVPRGSNSPVRHGFNALSRGCSARRDRVEFDGGNTSDIRDRASTRERYSAAKKARLKVQTCGEP